MRKSKIQTECLNDGSERNVGHHGGVCEHPQVNGVQSYTCLLVYSIRLWRKKSKPVFCVFCGTCWMNDGNPLIGRNFHWKCQCGVDGQHHFGCGERDRAWFRSKMK